jgi:hypothetical protein
MEIACEVRAWRSLRPPNEREDRGTPHARAMFWRASIVPMSHFSRRYSAKAPVRAVSYRSISSTTKSSGLCLIFTRFP